MQIMVRDAYAFGDDGEEDDVYDGPSKSEIKRQMLALQELGKRLTTLQPEALRKLPLPENVAHAVSEYAKIKTFKAQQRHIQHLGKLLRQADADAIRKALEDASGTSSAMIALHHKCEKMRDSLMTSDEPLTELINQFPDLDIQRLRQLIRQARREAAKEDPSKRNPKHFREIFQIIRGLYLDASRAKAEAESEEDAEDEEN